MTTNAQEAEAEAWLTEIVSPATVSDPVRPTPLLDAMLKETVPLPVPLPLLIEIHDTLLLATQSHPLEAFTETELSRAAEEAVMVRGVTEYVQSTTTGFASCAIITVRSAMAIDAFRGSTPSLGATEMLTVPDPVPGAPELIDTHDAPV